MSIAVMAGNIPRKPFLIHKSLALQWLKKHSAEPETNKPKLIQLRLASLSCEGHFKTRN